jgi:hypothetical protein
MAHVSMHHPTTCFHACQFSLDAETILQALTLKDTLPTHPHPRAIPSPMQTLKVKKVSPTEMAECRKQGICY